jgi:hypothetical protein
MNGLILVIPWAVHRGLGDGECRYWQKVLLAVEGLVLLSCYNKNN